MTFRDLYARYDDDDRRPSSAPRVNLHDHAQAATPGLLTILRRRKLIIAATIILCLVAGVLYIAIVPARYLASTSMLIDPRLGKTVGADPVQPGFIVDTGAMDSQIKLFTSQTVLARVAKMADLARDPEFNGSQRSLLQRLLHPRTDLEGGADLKALEQIITIKRPERTYVVGIDVLAQNPKKAAEIANDLTQAYIEDQVSARIEAAQDDTKFVRQQIARISAQLKDAQDKVEAFKTTNNVVDATGLRSNEQQVADLTKALGEARARASEAKAKLDEVNRLREAGRLDSSSDAVKSLTIERLRQQQAETEQNVARLATTLGTRHPELQEARSRMAKIDGLIRAELNRVSLSATADYRSASDNATEIAAEVDRLKSESTKISRDLVPLAQLERNVVALRTSLDRFAQIRDNISQQEADSPPGRVIATARPPVSPASPKKTLVAIVSLSAGVFFGLAAALLAESQSQPRPLAPPSGAPVPRAPAAPSSRRYWSDDDTSV